MNDLYQHRCVIQSGDMAGNKYVEDVEPWQFAHAEKCSNCGETLASTDAIVAHIYEQLTL